MARKVESNKRLKLFQVTVEKIETYEVCLEILAEDNVQAADLALTACYRTGVNAEFGSENWKFESTQYKGTDLVELEREPETKGFIGLM